MTRLSDKTILQGTLPAGTTIGADFNKLEFDLTIKQKGYNVIYEAAYRCPCKSKTNDHQSTCKNCGGGGWLWVNPTKTKMIMHSISDERKYQDVGREDLGAVQLTAFADNVLSLMDRITIVDGLTDNTDILYPVLNDAGTNMFAFTKYNIVGVDYLGLFVNTTTRLNQLLAPDDFTFHDNVIEFDPKFNAYEDMSVTVRYLHAPVYHVIDIARDTMRSTVVDGQGKRSVINLPIHALGKRAHLIKESENYMGNRLLDNSWEISCQPTGYAPPILSNNVPFYIVSASNIGTTGIGVYDSVTGRNLNFKNITAGSNITVTEDANHNIIISSTASGGGTWGSITGTITNQTDLVNYLSANYYPRSSNPAGYVTPSSVANFTNKSGAISQWTNDVGYLTSLSGAWLLASGGALSGPNTIVGSGANTIKFKFDNLNTSQLDGAGLWLANTTLAAAGAQQISPSLVFEGQGWKTNATAGSASVKFGMWVLPVQGAAAPNAQWHLQQSIAGGAYTSALFYDTSNGFLTSTGGFVAGASGQILSRIYGPQSDNQQITFNRPINDTTGIRFQRNGTGTYATQINSFVEFVGGQTTASAGLSYTQLLIDPIFNLTSLYNGVVIGIDYNPVTTSMTGATHYAMRSTAGGYLFAGSLTSADTSATLTANTKLDVRGTGQTTNIIQRWADSVNATRLTLSDQGAITHTGTMAVGASTIVNQFTAAVQTSGNFPSVGYMFKYDGTGSTGTSPSLVWSAMFTTNDGKAAGFSTAPGGSANYLHLYNTSATFVWNGPYIQSSFSAVSFNSATWTFTGTTAANVIVSVASAATGGGNWMSFVGTQSSTTGSPIHKNITMTHTLDFSGSVTNVLVYGYYYAPTRTNMTNVTEYAWFSSGGSVLVGSSSSDVLGAATTRLDVRGSGIGTNILARFADSSNNEYFKFQDNGTLTIGGLLNNNSVTFKTGSANTLTIDTSGNITIPTGTFSSRSGITAQNTNVAWSTTLPVGATIMGGAGIIWDIIVSATSVPSVDTAVMRWSGAYGNWNSAVSNVHRIFSFVNTYNITAGTRTLSWMDYNPTETSMTGVTHLGITVRSITALNSFGLAANPTALVHIGASTSARASLCVAHGAAPTSPVDGDIWTTTTGMFVRINGTTKSVNLT
jgi:hypothetical protein